MLGFLFGLNARMGRLQFFLATIVLAIVMTAICFFIAMFALRHAMPTMMRPEELLQSPITIVAIVLFAVASFTLQSMRIRDIGWDPVCVVPLWIAFMFIDRLLAAKFPALAIGQEHQGTVIGGLVNLVLMLILYFWPSGYADDAGSALDTSSDRWGEAGRASTATDRFSRISSGGRR
ncbi:DUF805 domain-containing protein [Bradyrhizobium liaoningense]|uniref:DUF805 domain-containing protein n=1 Tax=Bradyrhizobium liaoningense TaxID=43992 RepID=UPI001BA68F5A|nr:DUF805 domain-containing protein [Bradyrhizobium liaoningense]MBR0712901.1 DUF805 domain-containing protein [Bradyrhizobium liaoningense]